MNDNIIEYAIDRCQTDNLIADEYRMERYKERVYAAMKNGVELDEARDIAFIVTFFNDHSTGKK